MQRARTAREIARALFTAEDALDAAIRDFARLTSSMMEARTALGLSATIGPEVITRAAAVQASLARARVDAAEMHASLAEVKDGIGLRTLAVGVGDKGDPKPQVFTEGSAVRELRAG